MIKDINGFWGVYNYMNCEGIRGEENMFKIHQGLKIMIGGDMNAHIWEMDKCENKN